MNKQVKSPSEIEDDKDPIEKLFNFFFGDVEENPQGLQRFDSTRFPEQYPATLSTWAPYLPNDTPTESGPLLSYLPARYRPMLKNTNMESRDMVLTYDANEDGWDPLVFHEKLDHQGACLVVATTEGGQVCGGYNPKGWCGYGEYRGSVAAFLFTFREGLGSVSDDRPVKLRKVGGAGLAQLDFPETAVSFGSDSFIVTLSGGSRVASCKLGSYYERMEGDINTVFKSGKGREILEELKVYTGVYEEGEYIPFSDAEPFALN